MKTSFILFALAALFAATASASLTYSVEVSWNADTLNTSTAQTILDNGTDGDTLTLDFVPEEPTGPVGSPTNTAWGSLYLELSGEPSTGSDVYNFSGLILNLELIDTATSEYVTYTGTLSGSFMAASGGNSSSGEITWSPTGLQTLTPPSTVSFLTDSSDSIGELLDNGSFHTAATTVNGTVESTPADLTPEPATLATMGLGLLAVGLVSRRRRKN